MGLTALIPILGEVIDRVIPDQGKKIQLQTELAKLADQEAQREHEQMLGQIEVNKIEAGHRSIFIAGWRPALGWVGAVSLSAIYVIQPLVQMVSGDPVTITANDLMVLVGGMLGFGGMRSFDKLKGTSDDSPLGKVAPRTVIPNPISAVKAALPENAPWQ